MSLPDTPIGRIEAYLAKTAGQDVQLPPYPIGRIEEYLAAIAGSVKELTGNPLSFTTQSVQDAKSCVIALNPIQAGSGDPSPSNVREISGRDSVKAIVCKKNLVCKIIDHASINSDGSISGTSSSTYSMAVALVKEGETYTVTTDESSFVGGFFYSEPEKGSISYNGARLISDSKTFTSPITGYVVFRTSVDYAYAQIELGSTATEYEPYNPVTDLTLTLPETVYGGTIDVKTGVLTVDRKIINAKDLSWIYYAAKQAVYSPISDADISVTSEYSDGKRPVVCNIAKYASSIDNKNSITWGGISNNGNIIIYNDSTGSLTDWNTYIANNDVFICYYITPYTIQLTPRQVKLLAGTNYVSTDGDSIELTYSNGVAATLEEVSELTDDLNTRVPAPPTENGTYKLQVTVSDGVATYEWTS